MRSREEVGNRNGGEGEAAVCVPTLLIKSGPSSNRCLPRCVASKADGVAAWRIADGSDNRSVSGWCMPDCTMAEDRFR
jgi:hypothetical protein